jgi:hypothetical protein
MVRLGSQGAGAHQHHVGEGAQQPHQEAVGGQTAADQAALPGGGGIDRGDAVEGGDKVRVEELRGEAELAVVQLGERRRQLYDWEVRLLVEKVQETAQLLPDLISQIRRNSVRRFGSSA